MNWLKKPSTAGGIGYLVVLSLAIAGLVIVAVGQWRTGVTVMGLSFALAFVMRLVLPDDRAGMLRVRRRFVDLTTLAICGAAMLVLAAVVPHRQ